MARLVLIDGNSLLHRAFYALPPMSNRKGMPTGAVYGFISMLLKIIQDYTPSHIAVAFDKKGPTFRHERFVAYKGKRMAMPDDLVPQFDTLKRVLDAMEIARYEIDSFEADDILGTLSLKAEQEVMC